MRLKNLLLGTALGLSLVAPASAAVERHGWYIGLEAGWVHVNDTALKTWGDQEIQFENRWGVLGTAGYAFNGNWRLEFEPGYRTNDLHSILVARSGLTFPNDGKLTEWSGMFNAIYDQPIAERWTIDFGVGAGVDGLHFDDPVNSDTDAVFAAQGILGVTYRVSPHWDVMLNYRYLWADQPSFTDNSGNTDNMDITKHTVTFGVRYGFDDVAPPPPPPPPPAPPPAPPPVVKQFIIFFGFNKCDITPEADRVLGDAAATAKSTGAASIKIVGHTDTSGSNAYNQRLSECRANAAKTNMVGKGLPEASISTSGKGESELMVQTGDGVKEPQNRRATVDLE